MATCHRSRMDRSAKGCPFSDVFLSLNFIPRRKRQSWMRRRGFGTRRALILKWMVTGSVLIMGYKSILLSTFVSAPRATRPISTLDDMAESGLPLLIPEASLPYKTIAGGKNEASRQILDRSIVFQFRGRVPKWWTDM